MKAADIVEAWPEVVHALVNDHPETGVDVILFVSPSYESRDGREYAQSIGMAMRVKRVGLRAITLWG